MHPEGRSESEIGTAICNESKIGTTISSLANICFLIIIHFQMQETIPVTQLVRETAAVMKEFTQSGYATILGTFYLLTMYLRKGL